MCLPKNSAVQFLVCSLSICSSCHCVKLSDFVEVLVFIFEIHLKCQPLQSTGKTQTKGDSKVKERICGGVENWTCVYHICSCCLTRWISSLLPPFPPLWHLFFPCRCGNWELESFCFSKPWGESSGPNSVKGSGHPKYPGCAQFLHTCTSDTAWDASHNKITRECQQRIGVITQTFPLTSPS